MIDPLSLPSVPPRSGPSRAVPGRAARLVSAVASAALASVSWVLPLGAAGAVEIPSRAEARLVNDRTVGLVFDPEGSDRSLVEDMARELVVSDVRLVPIIGLDDVQTIYDLLYMSGIDLAVVRSDVLEYITRVQGFGQVYQRVSALAEIASEKIVVVAHERYRTLADLAGKAVNVGEPGEGADVTGTILFDTLGIEIEKTRLGELEALEKVKTGEIAATLRVAAEPLEAFTSLSPADDVRLIALPGDASLLEHYRATNLTSEEFPEMIRGAGAVPSLEVPVILAAYNWTPASPERFEKAKRFTAALVDALEGLGSGAGRSVPWRQVSLERAVPGVERFAVLDTVIAEREARERDRLAAAAAARIDELRSLQRQLTDELTRRLEGGTADPSELAEIERMIGRFEKTLQESGR